MSFFSRIFRSGSGAAAAPSTSSAIQRLQELEEMLQKKTDFLEQKIEEEIATAKKYGTKNKRVAIQALKRKKKYDKQLKQIDHTLTTLEFQRESLEGAENTRTVMEVMVVARDALRQATRGTSIEDVEKVVDDMQDMRDLVEEINSAFGMMNMGDDDEDEFEAELEALEEEALAEELSRVHKPDETLDLPAVPRDEPAGAAAASAGKSRKSEDEELRDLEQWFAA